MSQKQVATARTRQIAAQRAEEGRMLLEAARIRRAAASSAAAATETRREREEPRTPKKGANERECPGAPRKVPRTRPIVDFTIDQALNAMRSTKPYVPDSLKGTVRVLSPTEQFGELTGSEMIFMEGRVLVASGRVAIICPQGDSAGSVACASAPCEMPLHEMRNQFLSVFRREEHFHEYEVFVLSREQTVVEIDEQSGEEHLVTIPARLERYPEVWHERVTITDPYLVAAVFLVEDCGAPSVDPLIGRASSARTLFTSPEDQ